MEEKTWRFFINLAAVTLISLPLTLVLTAVGAKESAFTTLAGVVGGVWMLSVAAAMFIRLAIRLQMKNAIKLERPPLSILDSILCFLWSTKTYERVFRPAIADIVHDWQYAYIAGNTRRAWYIKHILGRWIMLGHVTAQLPASIVKVFTRFFQIIT